MKKKIIIKLTALFLSLFILIGLMIALLYPHINIINELGLFFRGNNNESSSYDSTEYSTSGTEKYFYDYIIESPDDPYSIGDGFVESKNINSIYLDWMYGNIDIIETDDTAIGISEFEPSGFDDIQLRRRVINGTLEIRYCNPGTQLEKNENGKKLTVSIPKQLNDKFKVSVYGNTSDIYISNVTLNDMQVDIDKGNITVNDCKINTLYAKITNGDFYANSHISNLSVNVKNGYIDCKFDKPTKNVDLKNVSGDINIRLTKNITGFLLKMEQSENTYTPLHIDYDYTVKGNIYSYGDESLCIKAKVGSTNIDIIDDTKDPKEYYEN